MKYVQASYRFDWNVDIVANLIKAENNNILN